MLASQVAAPEGFLQALWSTPSPWVGGIIGGLITGGLFGWVSYLRNIRPTLIFFRVQDGNDRIWQLKNVGRGVAAYVRVHDFAWDKKTIANKGRTYPIGPDDAPRKLVWGPAWSPSVERSTTPAVVEYQLRRGRISKFTPSCA
jgi:hypothetical protein